jgi:hypothetical protein
VRRVRPPRILARDGVVRAYDRTSDEGRFIAHRLGLGEYVAQWPTGAQPARLLMLTSVYVALVVMQAASEADQGGLNPFVDIWRIRRSTLIADSKHIVAAVGRLAAGADGGNVGGELVLATQDQIYRIRFTDANVLRDAQSTLLSQLKSV